MFKSENRDFIGGRESVETPWNADGFEISFRIVSIES